MTVTTPLEDVPRYPATLRLVHWAVVLLVIMTFPLGAVIKFLNPDVKLTFYTVHESLGFLVFWVMLLRVAVRFGTAPPLTTEVSPLLRTVAHIVHGLLYAALILQPLMGFLANCANGFSLDWFWLVPIACPIGKDPALARILLGGHIIGGWTILTLFALHMGGVLFHHVIRRDAMLYRII